MENYFANNLKHLLRQHHLTGVAFAQEIGVMQQAVSTWVNGTMPSIEMLMVISTYFDYTIDDLILSDIVNGDVKQKSKRVDVLTIPNHHSLDEMITTFKAAIKGIENAKKQTRRLQSK